MARTTGRVSGYAGFIGELKARVAAARLSAARAVNHDLIALYWDIGKAIVQQQQARGWGQSVVERIARDLRTSFPGAQGFSARNVWDMRRFYEEYSRPEVLRQLAAERGRRAPAGVVVRKAPPAIEYLRQLVAEIPWGHHLLILTKLHEPAQRLFYLRATKAFGWSRNVLLNQIKARACERSSSAGKSHNFALALPDNLAEQATEALKSSYNLEFLGIRQANRRRVPCSREILPGGPNRPQA
jgi:predicted nuclease of restriction endonuclease-like (RecB) superfamily